MFFCWLFILKWYKKNIRVKRKLSHPSAKAPDHCRRKPNKAEMIIAQLFLKFQSNNSKPGGSSRGINASKKNMVTGVVFHISLVKLKQPVLISPKTWNIMSSADRKAGLRTYASAVQFPVCCKFDHRILFTALGTIHANATQAPKKLNSRSVTVATATPNDTVASVITCKC
jgi:hypothetical protein